MKLKDFAKNINELLESRPEAAEYLVVSSKDDEGNGFNLVTYTPCIGKYEVEDVDFNEEIKANSVCIN